jgi:hypothetical protein
MILATWAVGSCLVIAIANKLSRALNGVNFHKTKSDGMLGKGLLLLQYSLSAACLAAAFDENFLAVGDEAPKGIHMGLLHCHHQRQKITISCFEV